MNHRRGQGLSVNMMILIALGLIVLVIAALMFSRSTREGQQSASNCELLGGKCEQNSTTGCSTDRFFGNCGPGYICCTKPPTP